MKCAGDVTAAFPLFQADSGGSIPTSALQLHFYRTDRETFKALNMRWHSVLPKIGGLFGRVYYAAEFDGHLYAVAMWSNPVARLNPQITWLELRRLAISDEAPKNTASRMLGWMARDIRKKFPLIVRLISYQDTSRHVGTIYKASGWVPNETLTRRPRTWGQWRGGRTDQSVTARVRWELPIQ